MNAQILQLREALNELVSAADACAETANTSMMDAAIECARKALADTASAQAAPGWKVRERRNAAGELVDCFVEAPLDEPMQPVVTDTNGVQRFRANALVVYLLENGPFDMNALALVECSVDDRKQFAQLIGYSLSGYGGLSYVTED